MTEFKRVAGPPHYEKGGYSAQQLYNGESCLIIGSTVGAGCSAPPHHLHAYSDQLYFVTSGTMNLQLAADESEVGPETMVWIPRGTPHHNWNKGKGDEFHLEMLAPAPLVTQLVATPTDSTEPGPTPSLIRRLDEVDMTEAMPGFSTAKLLQRSDGAEEISLYVGQVEPGAGGPPTHIHAFDQFYYVLEGELTVEVGFERFTAGPHELVILPAGVPHSQHNNSHARERHLTLLVPEPLPGEAWDVEVNFGLGSSAV